MKLTFTKSTLACGALLLLSAQAQAQSGEGVNVELRAYPSGEIFSVGWQRLLGPTDVGTASVLYNRAERGNNGRHDDEHGRGGGVSYAWDHFLTAERLGWSFEGRADLSRLRINYRDGNLSGQSSITVLQPTLGVGYSIPLGEQWRLRFGASVGAEINLRTKGSKVGDGAIGLLSLSIAPR